jgi:pimeloyl-ACP methyl ester carboxylesterase
MAAYRYLALNQDLSGNTLPTSSPGWCTDGTPNCLIQGKRIIYGRIFFPMRAGGAQLAQALGGVANAQYCDRYFGRDPQTGQCESTTSASSTEYTVFFFYQQSAIGGDFHNGLAPGVTQEQLNQAIANQWTQPTGTSYIGNELLIPALMPHNQHFPLVIFVGGNTGKFQEQALEAQNLAAQGYVTIVLDFEGNSQISQIGDLPGVKQLNPGVNFQPGGVNPVAIFLYVIGDIAAGREAVGDIRFAIDQLKTVRSLAPLRSALNLNEIGLVGYSYGTLESQELLAEIPEFKAGVLVNAFFNNELNNLLGPFWPLGGQAASGAAIPGWPGNTMNVSSPPLATGFTKPILVVESLQDTVLSQAGFGLDQSFPTSNVSGSWPAAQNLLNTNSTAPSFMTLVANANHFDLHSGPIGTYYYYNLLNQVHQSVDGVGTYTEIPGNIGVGISSYEELNFMNRYLKGQSQGLTNIQNISSVYPQTTVIINRP